jgi:hypothetical protein
MANLGTNFDASTVDPSGGFPLIPAGKYLAHIVQSEMKHTKDSTGRYLELHLEIIDGPYAKRKVFDRLNLYNQNEQTVTIAQRTLSQICHATGVMSVSDSEELHARRMLIDVRVEEGKGPYRDQNRIMSYARPDGTPMPMATNSAPTAQAQPAAAPAPAAARTGTAPPWRNRAQAS